MAQRTFKGEPAWQTGGSRGRMETVLLIENDSGNSLGKAFILGAGGDQEACPKREELNPY